MRFDDTFETVLAGEVDSSFAAQSAWRQIVDLCGRGRADFDARALDRLTALRGRVPLPIRVASTRPLEHATPPAPLVRFLVVDDLAVALPLLRSAVLDAREWIEILPLLTPPARSVLRNRRDLAPAVHRALEAYGPTDLVLAGEAAATAPFPDRDVAPAGSPEAIPEASRSFVSLGKVTRDMPVVAEAVRHAGERSDGPFEIAEVVARIEAFQRSRGREGAPKPVRSPRRAPGAAMFRFETDRFGIVTWIEGVNRSATLGLSLATPGGQAGGGDAIVAGALQRRAAFRDARLSIAGRSDAAGDWLLSATPAFDAESGRFTGYRGTARRPAQHERADPAATMVPPADSMRQLVHELRTPANAISGFAEMIEGELLGAVPLVYRDRARVIREQVKLLVGAIDDLDLAARIEGNSLELAPQSVAIAPMMAESAADLASLLALRGASIDVAQSEARVLGDPRALDRLVGRLFATVAASAGRGERIAVALDPSDLQVRIRIDRPGALDPAIDIDDPLTDPPDAMLLGADFALRLVRNLARELGGTFEMTSEHLTLLLPGADQHGLDQATGR